MGFITEGALVVRTDIGKQKQHKDKVKISNKVTEQLGKIIAGDIGSAPYLSGPKLVAFYNEFGFDDGYGNGFPPCWKYSTDKIVESNGTSR
ncbi:MAG TPA: hypothetical protein PK110_15870 [Niabella sp.]|nr:hypothetical protein [Chitinophagaceae bacterium]HRN49387.1 hypothetical protein [Niabella sp.]HRO86298.1 hypothetical protein [Niabella sp.]